MHHEQLQSADKGSNIGFNLSGVSKSDITKGMELIFSDDEPTQIGPNSFQKKDEKKGFFRRIFER
jgi:translation elongation factor EF-1alpha